MAFTPREKLIIKLYLVEGKSFAEVRRTLNDGAKRGTVECGHKPARFTVARLKQILSKIGRKALHYSNHFEKAREGKENTG